MTVHNKFLVNEQACMGQMGKWPWQCTTTGIGNSTELGMEKICQAVTEIWVLQVCSMTKQKHINVAIDSLSLITSTNSCVNQLQREFLKPSLARKYHTLRNSSPHPHPNSFGDNLADTVKQANATGSLMMRCSGRGRARGHFHPCSHSPYQYPGTQYGFQPYMGQSYRPRDQLRFFLRKVNLTMRKYAISFNWSGKQDFYGNFLKL